MKFIDKTGTPPTKLEQWKSFHDEKLQQLYKNSTGTAIWKYLDNNKVLNKEGTETYSKKELRLTLLEEQGFICCYCGQEIENNYKTAIEHLNPKSEPFYKNRTYDYANLLVSCDGGKSYKIHVVKDGETLSSIADDYGVSEEYLEETYIDIHTFTHIQQLTKLYDIENLQVGDRIFIIPKLKSEHQHCDPKKGKDEISLQPTQADIESYFMYLPDGKIDVSKNKDLEATIHTLGLNKAPLLVASRKKIIEVAKTKKREILIACNRDIEKYNQAISKLCKKYYTKNEENEFRLEPFAFVMVATLKN